MAKKSNRQMLNEKSQRQMDSITTVETSKLRMEYLKTALYPDEFGCRLPDELTQSTNLYRSLREFTLVANMDGTVNAGKFSFAVKPIIGDVRSPSSYQVGIVNNTTGWPTEFSLPGSYVSSNLYSDPRIDPLINQLTGPPLGSYSQWTNFTAAVTPTANTLDGQIFTVDNVQQENLQVTQVAIPDFILTDGPLAGYNVQNLHGYTTSPGVYRVHPWCYINGTLSNTMPLGLVIGFINTKTLASLGYYQLSYGATFGVGFGLSNLSRVTDWAANLYSTSQSLFEDGLFDIDLPTDTAIYFALNISNNGVSNVYAGFSCTATVSPSFSLISDYGTVVKLRPVACSALVTCTLPELTAGGNIVAYSAPSGDIDAYFYNTSSVMGPYQEWANLARNNKGLNTHDGNFKDGCYVWTQPWDKNDTLLRTPTESVSYPYQGIIVSGQVNPTVQLSGLVEIGRIRIVIIYEFITDSRLFLGESCFGSTADLDWVLAYLGAQRHAMENPEHPSKLAAMVKSAARWVTKAVPAVQSGLRVASGIASLFI